MVSPRLKKKLAKMNPHNNKIISVYSNPDHVNKLITRLQTAGFRVEVREQPDRSKRVKPLKSRRRGT